MSLSTCSSLFLSTGGIGLASAILLIMSLTYVTSTIRFRASMRCGNNANPPRAPVLPYFVPGLFNALSLINIHKIFTRIQRLHSDKPLLARAGHLRFFLITDPNLVKVIFRNSKKMSNKSVTLFALQHLLKLPKTTVNFYWADDSGMGKIPRKNSVTSPENRINFLISHNIKRYLSSTHLTALNGRYMAVLAQEMSSHGSTNEWITYPDLHAFIQQITIRASLEALIGSKIFEIYPNFVEDLMTFLSDVPKFFGLLPSLRIPRAYQARRRLLEGIKRWHCIALQNSNCDDVEPEKPEWEPYFGSKLLRIRQQYSLKLEDMTADARAAEDLGLVFASTGNVVTSTFWFIFEALKDNNLRDQMINDVRNCSSDRGDSIDIHTLTSQPLLQSAYAEVLRLYVAGAIGRVAEYQDIEIARYSIPKDSYLLMYTRSMAFNERMWAQAGRESRKPLNEFDAERFLVGPDWTRPMPTGVKVAPTRANSVIAEQEGKRRLASERRFSTDGLLGLWIPYGGGDHMCPGRHFAKHEIMLTFALLFSEFDLELATTQAHDIRPNMKFMPFGALPPAGKVPFRMRRKIKS
ncbi:cytochrome P450 [Xylaria curta]|nr:cytochrome P450 [Xylaria curta]